MRKLTVRDFHDRYRVDEESGCWIWTGPGNGRYGWFGKQDYAHRYAFRQFRGPIPEGHEVCHHCDTPRCVNPDHLFSGTRSDNMQDALEKGRLPTGEDAGAAKLTWPEVRKIRRRDPKTEEEIQDTARHYGISRRTLYRILRHETWKEEGHTPETYRVFAHPGTRHLVRLDDHEPAARWLTLGYVPLPEEMIRPARALVARRREAFVSGQSTGKLAVWLNRMVGLADNHHGLAVAELEQRHRKESAA